MHQYTFDVSRLRRGHSYGNSQVYCTLDAASNVLELPHRGGMRDSITQAFFLHAWDVIVPDFEPARTTFAPVYQETELRRGDSVVLKRFFVPFESNHLRSAHYTLASRGAIPATVRCRVLLPRGVSAARGEHRGHAFIALTYADGFTGVVWGSGPLLSLALKQRDDHLVEVSAEFAWGQAVGATFALSFAASPHGNALAAVFETFADDEGSAASHLRRVASVERESNASVERHLNTARLLTPDPLVTRGALWAKINQLRDYQEYARGAGFSNSPPSDQFVARDTFWFVVASNYYAQSWSRRMLETWFRLGLEPNGKFIEYMAPSRQPHLFRDDYGLNINDNTPLMLIATHHYYCLSGDRGFLNSVYSSLLQSANYILDQRNAAGLVWCTSTETFVRGLCTWRNCFAGGQISGAVTEINCECVLALECVADLAKHLGDERNADRLMRAADDLRRAINTHLRSSTANNPFYLQNIKPSGEPDDTLTADLFFLVLCNVSDRETSGKILDLIFGPRFWVTSPTGAAGMRTVAPDQRGAILKAEPGNYGLTGGVWPNLALWAGHAAAQIGRGDLLVQGLRGTLLLADREDFDRCNVTPGEFPEYFNGDDLVQRGNFRSTFIHGSYQWAALEGILGLRPRAVALEVNPHLPADWKWAAVQNLPYRGFPLSIFADAERRTLYTTAPVQSDWKQVAASAREVEDRIAAHNR